MNRRIKRKIRKNSILVLDMGGKPKSVETDVWMRWLSTHGIILWDNTREVNGVKPVLPYTLPKSAIRAYSVVNKQSK